VYTVYTVYCKLHTPLESLDWLIVFNHFDDATISVVLPPFFW
jgi:hypothetical protein